MFEKLVEFMDSFIEMGIPGCDCIAYQDGKQIFRYMAGYSDLGNKIPVNGTERYNIYSCSKPITCVAAMQLWEKGKFSLEDKLSDYMPEFAEMTVKTEDGIKKAENHILIKHLFEMTAGFSYEVYSPQMEIGRKETNYKCPTREMMKYLAKEPLIFEPGERWEYSLCHDVLAAFVEVVSGQKFEEYVKENIFTPLGMNDSAFLISEEERETIACQYRFNSQTRKAEDCGKGNWYVCGSEYASGGAGCISTVDDYIKFLEALRVGDVILKKETIQFMATDRLTDQQKQSYIAADNYGYGLGMRTPKEGGRFVDFGWGGAAGAHLAVDIPNGITIYYVQHLLGSPNQKIRVRVYEYLLADILGKDVTIDKTDVDGEYKYTF